MELKNRIQLLIFLGAVLFFLIQPLGARILLPVAGGSSQLWTSCMLFYQMAILFGYCYGHILVKTSLRTQIFVHTTLTIVSGYVLLAYPLQIEGIDSSMNLGIIFKALIVSLGVPLVTIGATSSLCQFWAGDYRLYAVSNLGSLGGLFLFPFILEPLTGVKTMLIVYKGIWGLYLVALVYLAVSLCKHTPNSRYTTDHTASAFARESDTGTHSAIESGANPHSRIESGANPHSAIESGAAITIKTPQIPVWEKLHWLMLAFAPSSLMLGVTAHMSNELPSFPLLWITPLAIYLISWIVAFRNESSLFAMSRRVTPLLGAVVAIILFVPITTAGFSAHLAVFFTISLLCHRTLFERKPPVKDLTMFYLITTTGGALGGIFNSIVAPVLFRSALEYPLVLILGIALVTENSAPVSKTRNLIVPAFVFSGIGIALSLLPDELDVRAVVARLLIIFFGASCTLLARRSKTAFTLSLSAVIFWSFTAFNLDYTIKTLRSFYGVSRVITIPGTTINILFHGSTIHGSQNRTQTLKREPLYCFHRTSPIGDIIRGIQQESGTHTEYAVIGLGTGALAAYGRVGDTMDFYEIDPAVIRIASDSAYFSYLTDSKSTTNIIYGDGRRELSKVPDYTYDLLVMDAFSSDAIPVHLITLEAIDGYFQKLKEGGLCAVNISNRHMDLQSLLLSAAMRTGYAVAIRRDTSLSKEDEQSGKAPSKWAVLGRTSKDLDKLNLTSMNKDWRFTFSQHARDSNNQNESILLPERQVIWTDDYSNILSLIQW